MATMNEQSPWTAVPFWTNEIGDVRPPSVSLWIAHRPRSTASELGASPGLIVVDGAFSNSLPAAQLLDRALLVGPGRAAGCHLGAREERERLLPGRDRPGRRGVVQVVDELGLREEHRRLVPELVVHVAAHDRDVVLLEVRVDGL